jgi:hypothetical protein
LLKRTEPLVESSGSVPSPAVYCPLTHPTTAICSDVKESSAASALDFLTICNATPKMKLALGTSWLAAAAGVWAAPQPVRYGQVVVVGAPSKYALRQAQSPCRTAAEISERTVECSVPQRRAEEPVSRFHPVDAPTCSFLFSVLAAVFRHVCNSRSHHSQLVQRQFQQ